MSVKKANEVLSSRDAFFALYKDPEWKAFSSRVRTFYANVCSSCRASNKPTQVHHWKYYQGRCPWQYELGEVTLLCADCHERFHDHLQNFRKLIFPRLPAQAFQVLNGALAVGLTHYDGLSLAYAFAELIATPGAVKRFADAWIAKPKVENEEHPSRVGSD